MKDTHTHAPHVHIQYTNECQFTHEFLSMYCKMDAIIHLKRNNSFMSFVHLISTQASIQFAVNKMLAERYK